MSTSVAAVGCGLSAFYLMNRSLLIASIVFLVAFVLFAMLLKIDRMFFHPSSIVLGFTESEEIRFDGAVYRIEALWDSPAFLVLRALEVKPLSPKRVRVLLGSDCISDEQWSEVQTWRVWCQRG
jgi:hypothetical protein